jgi:hypothetical protein
MTAKFDEFIEFIAFNSEEKRSFESNILEA